MVVAPAYMAVLLMQGLVGDPTQDHTKDCVGDAKDGDQKCSLFSSGTTHHSQVWQKGEHRWHADTRKKAGTDPEQGKLSSGRDQSLKPFWILAVF